MRASAYVLRAIEHVRMHICASFQIPQLPTLTTGTWNRAGPSLVSSESHRPGSGRLFLWYSATSPSEADRSRRLRSSSADAAVTVAARGAVVAGFGCAAVSCPDETLLLLLSPPPPIDGSATSAPGPSTLDSNPQFPPIWPRQVAPR